MMPHEVRVQDAAGTRRCRGHRDRRARLLPPQAAADHTPMPDTVTLVGSLQSELGCPGDWQPECDATHLLAGSRRARGVPGHVHRPGGRI